MRQVRQEVDSEVRGLKVQEGKVPAPLSSSSAPSCLHGWRRVKKIIIIKKIKAHKDEWFMIKTKEWKEGRISFFDYSM